MRDNSIGNKSRIETESAVSESIGFIIMLTIVITGIAMVTLYAYPLLLQSQITSNDRSMEQTMLTIQNEFNLLTYSNVPYRDTAVRVAGGVLQIEKDSELGASFSFIYSDLTGAERSSPEIFIGELLYTSNEGDAVYTLTNGAVIERAKGDINSVMAAAPRWYYDEKTKTLLIILTVITTTENYYLEGIGNLRMSMLTPPENLIDIDYTKSEIGSDQAPIGAQSIELLYHKDQRNDLSKAWESYFTSKVPGGVFRLIESDHSDLDTSVYEFLDVNRFVVKKYLVNINGL